MEPVHASQTRISRADARLRVAAAQRLVEASARGDRSAGQRFLRDAGAFGIDTAGLWAMTDPSSTHSVRHAYLGVPGAGMTLTIFVSPLQQECEVPDLAQLIDEATSIEGKDRLAQVLLEPGDTKMLNAFLAARFQRVADLAYLSRPRPGPQFSSPDSWGDGITVRKWRPGDDQTIAEALERTYEGTLDCPDLCGMRDPHDVVASHRATGIFDPNLWWLVDYRGSCEGVLLFNPCPAQSTVELVYIGLAPALRGRGLSRKLMELGLSAISGRLEREVSCAVDLRNRPALRLYESFGFKETSRRIALVRA
ncbi:MAG: GNAT family N-acetyltransferase [Phycisphaerales bacterium]|nr:GNAT family N-acetyltransferase [Phycisphaerales bacterium]